MTFSTNQVRHLYVVKGTQASVGTADTAGKLAVKADLAKSHLYFEYKSPGGLVRSDLIDIKNIIAAKATDATSLRRELGQVKVTLDSAINGGLPVANQDYLLRVAIRQFAGMSDEQFALVASMAESNKPVMPASLQQAQITAGNTESTGLAGVIANLAKGASNA